MEHGIPEALLTRRYALRADLWGLHREIDRREKGVANLQEKLSRLKRFGSPRTRVSKKIQGARDDLGNQLQDATDFIGNLRGEVIAKRKELIAVEQELRTIYRQVGAALATDVGGEEAWRTDAGHPLTASRGDNYEYDLFVSHATEDKPSFVRPLVDRLRELALLVWYDDFELSIGDSLRQSIDRGLSRSRYGLVVISPAFLAKKWTTYELDSLITREIEEGKVVLPIWHGVTKAQLLEVSPKLADKVALRTEGSEIDDIALNIAIAVMGTLTSCGRPAEQRHAADGAARRR